MTSWSNAFHLHCFLEEYLAQRCRCIMHEGYYCMSVAQFERIRAYSYLNDNYAMIRDKKDHNCDLLYKVRPVIDHFNAVSSSIVLFARDMSVDENICATKLKHTIQQYNPEKLHKWGFKLYRLCGIYGFIYNSK